MTYQFTSFRRAASRDGAATRPADPFVARLSKTGDITPDQARIITEMQASPRRIPARSQITRPDNSTAAVFLIREGWAFAYTLLANGERQVVGFILPGEVLHLGCSTGGDTELGVETITDVVITEISRASVSTASREWPGVFKLFFRIQSQILLGLIGQLTDVGRRDARARVAQLLLKLKRRLEPVGLTEFDGYDCPVSQYLIADALGLTAIHVNRVLRGLREEGVVTLRKDRVTIHDHARLMEIAGDSDGDVDAAGIVVMAEQNRQLAARRSGA